jgi:hypothetical protein
MINRIEELCEVLNITADKVNWVYISANQKLSEDFIEKHADKVYWGYISAYQKLSESFIETHADKVYWGYISRFQKLSEEFIEKHADKLDWGNISIYQKLSEEFIDKHADKLYWYNISVYQKLSEEFIDKHADKVDWNRISEYQKLSESFIKKHDLTIPVDSWLYRDYDFKLDYIKTNTDYEIDGDYVIAYKSCRSDGYSNFNFQYHYSVGNTYESHADFNSDNENSFGLSAWTKEGALEYCNQKLFKVKIHINDIACLVHDNKKIRCTKLTIIDEVNDLQ